jgi:uncharacterized repeat protein (TIGR03803 family)
MRYPSLPRFVSCFCLLLFLLTQAARAQDVLWGVTSSEGPKGSGTVFSIKSDGTTFTIRRAFQETESQPDYNLTQGSDGKFYGVASLGGGFNRSCIFRLNPDGSGFTVIKKLVSSEGITLSGALTLGDDGRFYGMTISGGAYDKGTIFQVNPDGSGFSVLRNMTDSDGINPVGSLIQAKDGKLYGMTSYAGAFGRGTIFRLNPDGSAFSVLKSMSLSDGANPAGSLIQGSDGKLYGMATYGGASNLGVVFRLSADGSGYTVLKNLNTADGINPNSGLMQSTGGKLLGMTSLGGAYQLGTLFQMNPDGSSFSIVRHLTTAEGISPAGALMQTGDGWIYGTAKYGGAYNQGAVFRFRPDGSSFVVLKNMSIQDGTQPGGSLIQGMDGELYGISNAGGINRAGAIYKYSANGSNFQLLYQFGSPESFSPRSGLVQGNDGALYGTNSRGGLGSGGIFKLNWLDNGFSILKSFDAFTEGEFTIGSLLKTNNGDLFGMHRHLGANGAGTIYKWQSSGIFSVVKALENNSTGAMPNSSLMQGQDGFLYGMLEGGGATGYGLVFRLNSDGSNFTVIRNFDYFNDGGYPSSSLVQGIDGVLYGLNSGGGANARGTVFKVNPNGTGFSVLHNFILSEGEYLGTSLMRSEQGAFYGTRENGGTYGSGFIFRLNPDGNGFQIIKHFNPAQEGANPAGALVEGSNGLLYGLTKTGGAYGSGTIYKLNPDGSGFSTLRSFQSSTDGRYPQGSLCIQKIPIITSFSPSAGSRGSSVVMKGKRFSGVTSIRFNGIPTTSFTLNDAETITVQVPQGATTGPLSVTTPNGIGVSTTSFVVSETLIQSFAPTSAPIGAAVAIRGKDFSSPIVVKFNGVTASNVSLESATLLVATVPAGASTGFIEVISGSGTAQSSVALEVGSVTSVWQSKTSIPTARAQHGAIALSSNGKVYAFGGYNGSGSLSSQEVYRTNDFLWEAGTPMPAGNRAFAYTLGSDKRIYVLGGFNGTSIQNSMLRFDPATGVWTSLASIPVGVKEASAAATTNGLIYVFGGQKQDNTLSNLVQVYSIATNTWSTVASLPVAVMQHQAVTGYNGKIYVFGGRTAAQNGLTDRVQIYNPTTNTWSSGTPMPIPKGHFATVRNNDGRIFMIGGKASPVSNLGPFFNTVEIYNPSADTWETGPVLPAPVGELSAVNSYGNMFAIGGSTKTVHNYNWRLVLPPVPPTATTATPVSASQIKVNWTDAAGNENRYEVERAKAPEGPWIVIATAAANVNTYTDGNRAAGTNYYYRVRGANSSGYGPYGPTVAAVIPTSGNATARLEGDSAAELVFSARPNPFSDQLQLEISPIDTEPALLELYDLKGTRVRELYQGELITGKIIHLKVDSKGLTPGVYLIRLQTPSQTVNQRIVFIR